MSWLMAYALYVAAPLAALLVISWPPRVRHHRISNYFFLRRTRGRLPSSFTSSGGGLPQRQPSERAGVEPHVTAPPARLPVLVDAAGPHSTAASARSPLTSVGAGVRQVGSPAPTGLPAPSPSASGYCPHTWGTCPINKVYHYCGNPTPCSGHWCIYCGASG